MLGYVFLLKLSLRKNFLFRDLQNEKRRWENEFWVSWGFSTTSEEEWLQQTEKRGEAKKNEQCFLGH